MADLAAIKARLAGIPGIDGLSMQILAGRHNYTLAGKIIGVDPAAPQAEIETAIRAALGSPAVAQMPAGTPAGSTTLLPTVSLQLTGSQDMSITGAGGAGLSLRALIEKRKAKIQADLEGHMKAIEAEFDAQDQVVAGVGALPAKIKSETDNLAANIGQFVNDILGEGK
ncbi:hypothetical protein JQ594_15525 [Bradyrhizobium manausense]|uniref:hypothetical protein n=1 Tax=Bradyrhizobium manausense TaxID=989370 RepID=UPI001BA445AF|nr:hypothetical protein [Bradyrhizobium manausense]MBR0687341.1 hypothetical protein [Bradyrhizobium manausense]